MEFETIKLLFVQSLVYVVFWAYHTAVYWAPPVLAIIFARTWIYYVRIKYNASLDRTLLEIKLPKEIHKSPVAMEIVLNVLHQGSEGSWYDQWIKGRVRNWSSLEMVSINGKIHFFIWIESKFRQNLEAQIYAQYPTVEIYEAEDYTQKVNFGQEGSGWSMFGSEFTLTKKDPYPIKTYVDYGLDKDPKEEFKIDPITSVLEFLASIENNEQIWIQIGVRATKKTNLIPGGLFGKKYDWKERKILCFYKDGR